MAFRHRPMRREDVGECVEIVAAHPVIGPRYGSSIGDLGRVWLGLLGRESFRAVVFEHAKDSQARTMGVGASVFVSDDFLRELKTPPFFWVGPELINRINRGRCPLLSDKQVRQANTDGGLNVVTWVGSIRGGAVVLSALQGRYSDLPDKPLRDIFAEPHFVGLTRELAMSQFGSRIGSLFVYRPPQFGFRPSEQRLLLAALQGGTDEDLATSLGISLSAVKKTWRLIYERVTSQSPGLIPDQVAAEPNSERGKEKKQRLLVYLREHPEELRPAGALTPASNA